MTTALIHSGASTDKELLTDRTYPSFSFLFRLHSGTEKQRHDHAHISSRCREALASTGRNFEETLVATVDTLLGQIDNDNGVKYISMFVAEDHASIFSHFINGPERCYVEDSFVLYEHLWASQMSSPYILLVLGSTHLKAYLVQASHLVGLASSPELRRLESAYKHKTQAKSDHLQVDSTYDSSCLQNIAELQLSLNKPLLLLGAEFLPECDNYFKAKGVNILGTMRGNFEGSSPDELSGKVEALTAELYSKESDAVLSKCNVARGQNKLATGIEEIAECSSTGRGALLALEEPSWNADEIKSGLVNEAIKHTLLNSGEVRFLRAGSLADWGGAALILRY